MYKNNKNTRRRFLINAALLFAIGIFILVSSEINAGVITAAVIIFAASVGQIALYLYLNKS